MGFSVFGWLTPTKIFIAFLGAKTVHVAGLRGLGLVRVPQVWPGPSWASVFAPLYMICPGLFQWQVASAPTVNLAERAGANYQIKNPSKNQIKKSNPQKKIKLKSKVWTKIQFLALVARRLFLGIGE